MGIKGQALSLGVCLPLLLTGCSSLNQGMADGLADSKKVEKLSCAQLADKSVEISKDKMVSLIKVRKLKVKKDNYAKYKLPTGDKEALILSCTGTGVWSTGDKVAVLLTYTIDADGDVLYGYEAQRS